MIQCEKCFSPLALILNYIYEPCPKAEETGFSLIRISVPVFALVYSAIFLSFAFWFMFA